MLYRCLNYPRITVIVLCCVNVVYFFEFVWCPFVRLMQVGSCARSLRSVFHTANWRQIAVSSRTDGRPIAPSGRKSPISPAARVHKADPTIHLTIFSLSPRGGSGKKECHPLHVRNNKNHTVIQAVSSDIRSVLSSSRAREVFTSTITFQYLQLDPLSS